MPSLSIRPFPLNISKENLCCPAQPNISFWADLVTKTNKWAPRNPASGNLWCKSGDLRE